MRLFDTILMKNIQRGVNVPTCKRSMAYGPEKPMRILDEKHRIRARVSLEFGIAQL